MGELDPASVILLRFDSTSASLADLTAQTRRRRVGVVATRPGGSGLHRERAATIYDVAAAAGVSHQTIANVLRFPSRVAPSTRERVERCIAELGFRPNRTAQNLSRRSSRLIGFRVQASSALASGGLFDRLLQELAAAAEAIDHHIVLYHSAEGLGEVAKAVELYAANVADAFVITETGAADPRIPALVDAGLTFVAFGRTEHPGVHHWVDTDNVAGGRLAAAHLADLGHRTIGFVGWPGPSWVGEDRLAGWRAELAERRLRCDDGLVATALNRRDLAAAASAELLGRHPGVTAIVAASDELALGALEAAAAAGRSIALVGYDDSPAATIGAGLTSVRQPIAEIAKRIVDITARLLAGEVDQAEQIRVAPELIIRGSSGVLATR